VTDELAGLLAELEARWASAHLAVAAALRPGAAVERVVATVGDVPELVGWWTWHDGAAVPGPPITEGPGVVEEAENYLPGDWHILSLDEAVRIHDWYRADLALIGGSDALPASWFPMLKEDSVPGELWYDREGGALFMVDFHAALPEDPPTPMFTTMAELVRSLIAWVDTPEPGSRNR
jgi:hypothetical protein